MSFLFLYFFLLLFSVVFYHILLRRILLTSLDESFCRFSSDRDLAAFRLAYVQHACSSVTVVILVFFWVFLSHMDKKLVLHHRCRTWQFT